MPWNAFLGRVRSTYIGTLGLTSGKERRAQWRTVELSVTSRVLPKVRYSVTRVGICT